ncbi:MAG: hypothetical protein J6P72_04725 [Firmicutes bacterium]|nr:hypothetical protein [Bacillota bacterium]
MRKICALCLILSLLMLAGCTKAADPLPSAPAGDKFAQGTAGSASQSSDSKETSEQSGTENTGETDTENSQETAAEPESQPESEPEPEPETPAVETSTLQLVTTDPEKTLTIEYPALEGLEYKEYGTEENPKVRFINEAENISLEIFLAQLNTESLQTRISGGSSEEAASFGDLKGYLEFSTWAINGTIDMGPYTDTVSVIVRFDLRRADTYQADDEAQLRGFLENETVQYILSHLTVN